jgi:HAD superfamily hydrolase (TIGR01509 family)
MSAGFALPSLGGLRAVVFDMDGVLIDTEPAWRRAEMRVFASVGLHLSEADCRGTMGMRVPEAVQMWFSRHPWSAPSVAAVADEIVAEVIDHVRGHGTATAGALEAISTVRACGLHCAIASSSPPSLIDAVVERLGIQAQVDATCSAEAELRGKPAPDVYLRAASLLAVPPAACLAVEDSPAGVLSARAAGMPCVVIPDEQTTIPVSADGATLRLASLRELDRASLESISAAYFA